MTTTNHARVKVESGDELDVRSFSVAQAASKLFRVELTVVSRNVDVDFDEVIGNPATFTLETGRGLLRWSGVCIAMDQLRVDAGNLATYALELAPRAYLLTQRKNYRIFQYRSEVDIVRQLLGEWGVAHRVEIDAAAHKPRKFRVQYAESDFDFACRMLEDAGASFFFEDGEDGSVLVIADRPEQREIAHRDLPFFDRPNVSGDAPFVTRVAHAQRTRHGRYTIGDLDYRRASTHQPRLSAAGGLPQEALLERFDYEPGAFLYQGAGGGNTPTADDRGAARTDEGAGSRKTASFLHGERQSARRISFESNLLALVPGSTLSMADHPSLDGAGLLVTSATITGDHDGGWTLHAEAVGTDVPFKPPRLTPKPRVRGLESATVVGPSSEEIHTDEYARVRVHFHWDRESRRNEESSCWVPTNQPWAGASFGGVNLPRIGQEVLVEFLGGDPDRPVVIGRVFTEHQPPPYPMPEGMKITGIVGKASPAMIVGAAGEPMNMGKFQDVYAKEWSDAPFKAQPPPPQSPYNWDNQFLMGDAQGQDIAFIQARRDLNFLVKNNWTSVVGNYRGCYVGSDDLLTVRNKQKVDVVENQQLRVTDQQRIDVGKLRQEKVDKHIALSVLSDVSVECQGVANYKAPESIVTESLEQVRFEVDQSSITVTRASIVIESPKVDINPKSS